MQIIHVTMEYLRNRQSPAIMYLHIMVIFLVLTQLIVSNFIEFSDNGEISKNIIKSYGTWLHIITGILLAPFAITLIYFVIKAHGIKYFFPYFSGNYSKIKSDIHQLKQLKIPDPGAYGLASIVQGLGMSALLSVLISGLT